MFSSFKIMTLNLSFPFVCLIFFFLQSRIQLVLGQSSHWVSADCNKATTTTTTGSRCRNVGIRASIVFSMLGVEKRSLKNKA